MARPRRPQEQEQFDDERMTQLATRIPQELHRRVKLHTVSHGLSMMIFVTEALEAKLAQEGARAQRRHQPRRAGRPAAAQPNQQAAAGGR